LKIALMTDTYHPQVNGVVSSIDTIAEEVGKKHEVRIFAPTKAKYAHGFRSVTFHPYPDYKIALVRPRSVARIFRKEGMDIVHVHTPFSLGLVGVGAARELALPVVGTFHTLLPEYTHYISKSLGFLLRRLAWRYVRWFYNRCNAVTTPSSPIRRSLVERGLKNVHVIPNAVNVNLFRQEERPPNENPCILFVGRLGREKKIEVLVDAAPKILKEHPKAKFRIVGMGVREGWYKNLVRKRGLTGSFVFERYLKLPDLVDAYRVCDVFAMPSDTETQGLVTLEAMACGKPVVGADARGLKDVITHDVDGYLFQPGSSDELADYVLGLLADEGLRRKMGKRAREKAEKFSSEKIGEQWIRFYSSLLR
jgi:1,2-diacylglycerol 3-alpha-glucosyltransferase